MHGAKVKIEYDNIHSLGKILYFGWISVANWLSTVHGTNKRYQVYVITRPDCDITFTAVRMSVSYIINRGTRRRNLQVLAVLQDEKSHGTLGESQNLSRIEPRLSISLMRDDYIQRNVRVVRFQFLKISG